MLDALIQFAQWIGSKIDAVIQALINFFVWLIDLLKDILLFCFDGILSGIVAVIGAIPIPSFASTGLQSVVSGFSPQLGYFLAFSGLGDGLLIIGYAFTFYLLRKFATLFQW